MKTQAWSPLLFLGLWTLTACSLHNDRYPPAMPAERKVWDNTHPFMFDRHATLRETLGQPSCPSPVSLPPRPHIPSIVPEAQDWGTYRSVPQPKQACRGQGRKRTCRYILSTVAEQAKQGALIKPARRYMDKGMSGKMRYPFTPGADPIYEIPVGVISPTYLILPPGKRSARVMKLHKEYWDASYVQVGEGEHQHERIALIGLEEGYEAYTAIELQSGEALWLKLVTTHDAGLMSVTWDFPASAKPDVLPVAQRPPKINRERIHSDYVIEKQGKYAPPWMPAGVFDDGTRTYVYFKEALTYTRAPAAFAIDQKGDVNLTQSHLFVQDQHPEQGVYLMLQGLWPAFKLRDSAGLELTFRRTNPTPQGQVSHDRY